MTRKPQPLRFTGDIISKSINDTTVELQWIRPGVYTVTTLRGGFVRRLEDIASWADEQAARDHAAMLCTLAA